MAQVGAVGMRPSRAHIHDPSLTVSLPPALGVAADLGLALSLVLVLLGWGAIGMAAGIGLGAASVAAVIFTVVQRLGERRPGLGVMQPAAVLVRDDGWDGGGRRAA